MTTRSTSLAVLLSLALVLSGVGTTVGAVPLSAVAGDQSSLQTAGSGENVSAGVGQQLSTVISTTGVTTSSSISTHLFDRQFENASESERARLVARRAATLESAASALRGEFDNATAAYRNGDLSTDTYAQRLANSHARAMAIIDGGRELRQAAQNVSALELRAAGYDPATLEAALDSVRSLSGSGLAAIRDQFTGASDVEVLLDATDGLSITADDEGEFAREFERADDGNLTLSIAQSVALETARNALSEVENGTWHVVGGDIDVSEGIYDFEFDLSTRNISGTAEVTVDGSSGSILALEEEIEQEDERGDDDGAETADRDADDQDGPGDDERDERDAEDDRDEDEGNDTDTDDDRDDDQGDEDDRRADSEESDEGDDGDDAEFVLLVAEGRLSPGERITLQVLADGMPVPNVSVEVEDVVVGSTGPNGTLRVTVPEHSTEIEAGEATLSLEFDGEREDAEVFERLETEASLSNGTVTVIIEFDNESVENASVWVNDRMVGRTDADGQLVFDIGSDSELELEGDSELELEVVKGAYEAELEYEIQAGSLVLTESSHEGDGDKVDADEDRESEDDAATEGDDEESAEEEDTEDNDSDGDSADEDGNEEESAEEPVTEDADEDDSDDDDDDEDDADEDSDEGDEEAESDDDTATADDDS